MIRVIGFNWSQFQHPWSKNGIAYSPNELACHLKVILKAERKLEIPMEPPIELPQRKQLPALGELTADAKALDEKMASEGNAFLERTRNLRRERESMGMGDRHQDFQPQSMPVINSLVNERIDVYTEYDIKNDDGSISKDYRWCQGKVLFVSDGTNIKIPETRWHYKSDEAVMVLWDPIPELDEPEMEYPQRLQPSKWNPEKPTKHGWRLDIKIDMA